MYKWSTGILPNVIVQMSTNYGKTIVVKFVVLSIALAIPSTIVSIIMEITNNLYKTNMILESN
jgi:hypothetical protein